MDFAIHMRGKQVSLGKRLKSVIKEEGISQREFAKEVNLSQTAIEHYIAERRVPSGELFIAIGHHEQFKKYIMWLLTGDVEEDSDQVSPKLSTQKKCGLVSDDSGKQA